MKENRYRHVQLCRQLWGENWGYSGPCRRCLWEYTWELVIWRHVDLRRCANNLSNIVTAHCKSAWRKMMSSQVYSQRLMGFYTEMVNRVQVASHASFKCAHPPCCFCMTTIASRAFRGKPNTPNFCSHACIKMAVESRFSFSNSVGEPKNQCESNPKVKTVRNKKNNCVLASCRKCESYRWTSTCNSHVYQATATPILYFCSSNKV